MKKHEKIKKEIQRMEKLDKNYCSLNSCEPSDFMQGKQAVYAELLIFIDKLK